MDRVSLQVSSDQSQIKTSPKNKIFLQELLELVTIYCGWDFWGILDSFFFPSGCKAAGQERLWQIWVATGKVKRVQSMLLLLRLSHFFLSRCPSRWLSPLTARVPNKSTLAFLLLLLFYLWRNRLFRGPSSIIPKDHPSVTYFLALLGHKNLPLICIKISLTLFKECEEKKFVVFLNT